MLKHILKLDGAQKLDKSEQQQISGGKLASWCPVGCGGKNTNDPCYASSGCKCPGRCGSKPGVVGLYCWPY